MLNRQQFLLTKLAEEASEIVKASLKSQQFGLELKLADGDIVCTNKQLIHNEINDLLAIVEMLNEEYNFQFVPNKTDIETKKFRVNMYSHKSVNLGQLEDNKK